MTNANNQFFQAGDKIIITCGLGYSDRMFLNVVGEVEMICADGMAWVAVKAKGMRKARSVCVNPRTMLVRA